MVSMINVKGKIKISMTSEEFVAFFRLPKRLRKFVRKEGRVRTLVSKVTVSDDYNPVELTAKEIQRLQSAEVRKFLIRNLTTEANYSNY